MSILFVSLFCRNLIGLHFVFNSSHKRSQTITFSFLTKLKESKHIFLHDLISQSIYNNRNFTFIFQGNQKYKVKILENALPIFFFFNQIKSFIILPFCDIQLIVLIFIFGASEKVIYI